VQETHCLLSGNRDCRPFAAQKSVLLGLATFNHCETLVLVDKRKMQPAVYTWQ
jgi:hypothetical protein